MNEYCNLLKIIPLADIILLADNKYDLRPNKEFDILPCDTILWQPKAKASDAGISWSIKEELVIDKVSEEIVTKYSFVRYTVLIITTILGDELILGSQQYPVLAFITPNIQSDFLSVELNTPIRPII